MGEECRKCFVGQLPVDIKEDEIDTIFSTYGKVVDVRIIDGKPVGTQKCAFVEFQTEEAAKIAIQVLNDVYKFRHESEKAIRVEACRERKSKSDRGRGPNGNGHERKLGNEYPVGRAEPRIYAPRTAEEETALKVFVGQLPIDIRDDEVRTIFNTYGQVTRVKIIDGKPPGSQKCAFVEYSTQVAAKAAVQVLHDVYKFREESEKPIRVEFCRGRDQKNRIKDNGDTNNDEAGADGNAEGGQDQKGDKGGKGGGKKRKVHVEGAKLYVANLPEDIAREALESVFGTYGYVSDIYIMHKEGSGKCAAFISYDEAVDAKIAVAAMEQGYEIRPGQGNLQVAFAREKRNHTRPKPS